MSRVIKFRAFDDKQHEWFYFNLNDGFLPSFAWDCQKNRRLLKKTVGQFTGLLDKKGLEIYEGDVLRSDAEEGIAVVSYSADTARFEIEILGYEVFTGENSQEVESNTLSVVDAYEFGDWGEFEVIGNIHENPELLKAGNNA